MSFNFADFKTVNNTNERTSTQGVSRGQNFKFRFKRFMSNKANKTAEEILFFISNAKFDALDLSNKGLKQLVGEDKSRVYLAVVDNDQATILKRTEKLAVDSEKQKKFKSTVLEKACIEAGLINPTIVGDNQYLDLVVVSNEPVTLGDGVVAHQIVEIVKDTETVETDEDKASTDANDEAEESIQDADAEAGSINGAESAQDSQVASPSAEVEDDDEF